MIYASDHALLHTELTYETPEPDQPDAHARIVREAVAATHAVAGDWLGPVGIGGAFVDRDPGSFYEERGAAARMLLRLTDAPAELVVSPAVADSMTIELARLDANEVETTLLPALTGPSIGLDRLIWTAVKARSPTPQAEELAVGTHRMTPPARAEGGTLWYYGPSGMAGPPVRITVSSTHWIVTLHVDVFWDAWISDPAGRALLDAGLARVHARGWR